MKEERKEQKAIYSELRSYYIRNSNLSMQIPDDIGNDINRLIDRLSQAFSEDFSKYKTSRIYTPSRHRQYYPASTVLSRLSALLARLEVEFEEENKSDIQALNSQDSQQPPIVINFAPNLQNSQHQRITVTLTPISQLIDQESNEEIKKLLEELRDALEEKNKNKISGIIKKVSEISFELLIRIMPFILERWAEGNLPQTGD